MTSDAHNAAGDQDWPVASYKQRVAALRDAAVAELADLIRPAVMLSMSFTSQQILVFDHASGKREATLWSHDYYDLAHAALNELARRAKCAETQ